MKIVLLVVLVVAALLALDRLFLFFEKRGWMYWRRSRHGSGNAAVNAVLEAHAALEPRVRHVIEQRQKGGGINDSTGEAGVRRRDGGFPWRELIPPEDAVDRSPRKATNDAHRSKSRAVDLNRAGS
jgi:hypothetical protein